MLISLYLYSCIYMKKIAIQIAILYHISLNSSGSYFAVLFVFFFILPLFSFHLNIVGLRHGLELSGFSL